MLLYKHFFVVKGKGEDNKSQLNAFDKALMDAKIANQNLVPVTSILPEDAKELKSLPHIKIGEIIHCVLARMSGEKNEEIGTGLIYGMGIRKDGVHYGIVAEASGNKNNKAIRKELLLKIRKMAKIRGLNLKRKKINTVSFKVKQRFGSAIVALIYR